MIEFRLPSLGSDMDEGQLVEWRVRPGQAVKKGDVVAVVDTAKAAVDVEIWVHGYGAAAAPRTRPDHSRGHRDGHPAGARRGRKTIDKPIGGRYFATIQEFLDGSTPLDYYEVKIYAGVEGGFQCLVNYRFPVVAFEAAIKLFKNKLELFRQAPLLVDGEVFQFGFSLSEINSSVRVTSIKALITITLT